MGGTREADFRARIGGAQRLALDTNALVYFLGGHERFGDPVRWVLERAAAGALEVVVSAVTEAELLVRPWQLGDQATLEAIDAVTASRAVRVAALDRRMARQAARLRVEQGIPLVDAFIIATAKETGCEVVIGNDRRCGERSRDVEYLVLGDYF